MAGRLAEFKFSAVGTFEGVGQRIERETASKDHSRYEIR